MSKEMSRPELEPNYSHPIYEEFENMKDRAPLVKYAVYALLGAGLLGVYALYNPQFRERVVGNFGSTEFFQKAEKNLENILE